MEMFSVKESFLIAVWSNNGNVGAIHTAHNTGEAKGIHKSVKLILLMTLFSHIIGFVCI